MTTEARPEFPRKPEETLTWQDCLDWHGDEAGGCDGPVEYRMPLSSSGRAFPRCESHWQDRLKRQEEINERYPDSPIAPSWFDPSAAGERWNEDD